MEGRETRRWSGGGQTPSGCEFRRLALSPTPAAATIAAGLEPPPRGGRTVRFRSTRSGWAQSVVSLAGILVSLALHPAPVGATAAFGWRELAPPLRSGHSAVYDAL